MVVKDDDSLGMDAEGHRMYRYSDWGLPCMVSSGFQMNRSNRKCLFSVL